MPSSFGLLLTGSPTDLAVLREVARDHPGLLGAPWWVSPVGEHLALVPVEGGSDAAREPWVPVELDPREARRAAHLFEAIPPRAVPGEAIPDEACFLASVAEPAARLLVERLLRLGRDDARLAELEAPEGRRLLVVLERPPLYLLMRARDEAEGVRVYTRHRATPLWVAWGFAHPLAELAAAHLDGGAALVDGDGTWRRLAEAPGGAPIADHVRAVLDPPRETWSAAPGRTRFDVPLRLVPAAPLDPELWLLDADAFLRLEGLVAHASPDALNRLTVGRLRAGDGSVRYALRERPGRGAALGAQVAELLGQPGLARVTGTDGLYIPVDRRLEPPVGLAELRRVLALEDAPLVVLDEQDGAPRLVHLAAAPDAPLSSWVEYAATDRREALDAAFERMVFEVSEPVVERAAPPRAAPPTPGARRSEKRRRRRPWLPRLVDAVTDRLDPADVRVARARAAELQPRILEGGCDEAAVWRALGEALGVLGDGDDAALCLEAAAFLGDEEAPALLGELGGRQDDEAAVEAATCEAPTPLQASRLGARVLADLGAGRPLLDGLGARVLQLFTQPGLPVSRRLSWAVQRTLHAQSGDRLGLTRSREALVGALNVDGLREACDAPRFVRTALALGDTEATVVRGDQAAALRGLWGILEAGLGDGDPQALLYRAAFAVGFQRLGDGEMSRPLAELVEEESPVHDAPVQALARLYLGSIGADDEGREDRLEAACERLSPAEARAARFFVRKSRWLSPAGPPEQMTMGAYEAELAELEATPTALPGWVEGVLAAKSGYDAHIARAAVRAMWVALGTGSEELVEGMLAAALGGIDRLTLLAPRAELAGAALRAAALVSDEGAVDALVGEVTGLAPRMEAVGQLLSAIGPALAALRRVGASDSSDRFLAALWQVARRPHDEAPKVGAFLAEGYWLAGNAGRAEAAIDEVEARVLGDELRHLPRYEGAAAMLDALRSWPLEARRERAERLLLALPRFNDAFTTRRWLDVLRVLLVEGVVDAIADARTFASARLRRWLEAEEQVTRRRVLKDWRRFG